jgi:tetratricopeptide (TPR) repeat protein
MDSSIIPGVKTLIYSINIFIATLLICGCDEATPSSKQSSTAAQWVQEASSIAQKIPVDIHGVERDRALAKSAVTALELGLRAECQSILQSITSWHKAELCAQLARSCYAAGDLTAGDELLDKAHDLISADSYENWQVSRIRLAIEQAGHAKGNKTDSSVMEQVETADQARLLPALVQANVAQTNLIDMLTRLEATTNQVMDLDTAAGTVDTFLVLYQASQQSENDAVKELRGRILAGVESAFRGIHAAIACEKMVDFCKLALTSGDPEFARQLSRMVRERLPSVRADMRLPIQLKYADYLLNAGEIAAALDQAEWVESEIGDESVLFSERPVLLARCGVVYQRAGERERAQLHFRQALIGLDALTNGRPRAVTAVDVALIFARADVEMPSIHMAMKELNSNLGDPW